MKTFLYIYGNPAKATFITQAVDWEHAEARVKEALKEQGFDLDNYSAQLISITTPIQFV